MNSDAEAQLFADFRTLVQACRPVTADSIRDSLDEKAGNGRQYIWWGKQITVAAAAVRRFSLVSFIALFALLGVQSLWVWGTYLVEQVKELQTENDNSLAAQISAAATRSNAQSANSSQPATGSSDVSNLLATKQANLEARMEAVTDKLDGWMQLFDGLRRMFPEKAAGQPITNGSGVEDAYPRLIRNLVAANIYLVLLQSYILPLLYGFLGTCTFVLRQLIAETKAHTYRREMEITYWLRVFLGSLAGFAIGWFLRPDSSKDGLVQGLTPFAISFLAGYSVEVLFAGMDRLVSAFGSAPQTAKG
jgi:hypothetical protein